MLIDYGKYIWSVCLGMRVIPIKELTNQCEGIKGRWIPLKLHSPSIGTRVNEQNLFLINAWQGRGRREGERGGLALLWEVLRYNSFAIFLAAQSSAVAQELLC